MKAKMDLNLAHQRPTEAMFEMVGQNVSEVNHEVDWGKMDAVCLEEEMAYENDGSLEIQDLKMVLMVN